MQLRITTDLVGGDFQVTIGVDSMSARETENLARRGSFIVDFGGIFTPATGAGFTLPTDQRSVPDELPIRRVFSTTDLTYAVAQAQASLYAESMRVRIHNKLSDWLLPDPAVDLSDIVVSIPGNQPTPTDQVTSGALAAYLNL